MGARTEYENLQREVQAWQAGFEHGKAGTYDMRQFPEFRFFTAYGKGWEHGWEHRTIQGVAS